MRLIPKRGSGFGVDIVRDTLPYSALGLPFLQISILFQQQQEEKTHTPVGRLNQFISQL
jgi:hypothetical protein